MASQVSWCSAPVCWPPCWPLPGCSATWTAPVAALGGAGAGCAREPPQAVTVPVEQLAADLRRLAAYLETVYDTEQPAKMERRHGRCARVRLGPGLRLPHARGERRRDRAVPPLDPIERLTVEAALARHGLTW